MLVSVIILAADKNLTESSTEVEIFIPTVDEATNPAVTDVVAEGLMSNDPLTSMTISSDDVIFTDCERLLELVITWDVWLKKLNPGSTDIPSTIILVELTDVVLD